MKMCCQRLYSFILLCLLPLTTWGAMPDAGVPLSLARQRSSQLQAIEYKLSFTLPEKTGEAVKGRASISFLWNGEGDVVLDFQGSRHQFGGTCTVLTRKNAKKKKKLKHYLVHPVFANEHIIIPKAFLNMGVRNTVIIDFVSGDKSLNRHDDYLYTLFVPDHARSVFPCFDQPDLKATFQLSLNIPTQWTALSNAPMTRNEVVAERRNVDFSVTDKLPTYLFSFTAGRFASQQMNCAGRRVEAFYRETDSQKVAQLPTVFEEVALALQWMEQYTGIPYPFQKYAFVILPGYQFGGMEHPGAIQFNDKRLFLGKNPTPDEQLARTKLIAHETAHIWFGDLVTMRWFDDVWTKEVFANYMAAKIVRQRYPDINHDLSFLKTYQSLAHKTDRTLGTHPIHQPLDNLNKASLLYGNIIYDKAPVMMQKLEEQMGAIPLQNGLRKYLHRYAFGNATWDELIDILSNEKPDAALKQFSEAWVKQKGRPDITVSIQGKEMVITQHDPTGRGTLWNQQFDVMPGNEMDRSRLATVNLRSSSTAVPLKRRPDFIIPNYNGNGYGRFILDSHYSHALTKRLLCTTNDLTRYAIAQTLFENYLHGQYDKSYFTELFRTLRKERNPLIASTLCEQLHYYVTHQPNTMRQRMEPFLLDIVRESPLPSCRQTMLRLLATNAITTEVLDYLYQVWKYQNDPLLNERDYIVLSYHLAIMRPTEWQSIVSTQRSRLKGEDLLREYDYVSRACTPDADKQQQLFNQLLRKENRRVEPWAQAMLALLSCEAREPHNNRFITPGLEVLEEIQQTGDIFFPANWLHALLDAHQSNEAREQVSDFLHHHPDYPTNLKNKIQEAAWGLYHH